MSNEQLQSILEMDGEERYDYFLSAVIEERELWILVNADNHFLKLVSEDDGLEYVPVWPNEAFALAYAEGAGDLSPKNISLPEFFRKWVPGLTGDGLEVGVFPGLDRTLWITGPSELKDDLQDELTNL